MAGDFTHSEEAAGELAAHVAPMLREMPIAETYAPYPIFVLVRFHRWDEVLKVPAPNPSLAMTTAFWHFARGAAFAAKSQIEMAEAERKTLEAAYRDTPADLEFSFYSNEAKTFLDLVDSWMRIEI